MASLPDNLRHQLEKAVVQARDVAEAGARAALERLAVDRIEPFREMLTAERELRVQLRAHARQLGDSRKDNGEQVIERLISECAYEHWHRMLFARFLAENRLLIHPEHGVPVTLVECEELAADAGEKDGWVLAGRFAARMLPAIFRPDDPVLQVRLAPEHQQVLEKLLAGLPAAVFTAHDSLGWVYQFWQARRKDEVNESGRKIGAAELAAVTQFFTEPYMVKFLLHNALGAWWAGKMLVMRPELALLAESEEELRQACGLPGYEWVYLRFIRRGEPSVWRPAAGTLEAWPARAGELKVLDPCCGSGHFLVEAFRALVPMRMTEEGLSAPEACEAVLRDNLFGLEIDERCTQIAAFNLALTAWSYPETGGYRSLPELPIACSGLAVGGNEREWLRIAGRDERLREGMRRLHRLFQDAPTLGSLIDPRREEADLITAGFEELQPLLARALAREEVRRDAQATEAGVAAQGMAKAAVLLAGRYTLVATNVPYLKRSKQDEKLHNYCERLFPKSKSDLATVFVEHCLSVCSAGGTIALVTPQNWHLLTTYTEMRRGLLQRSTWNLVVNLGRAAFRDMNWWAMSTALTMISARSPETHSFCSTIDLGEHRRTEEKTDLVRIELLQTIYQSDFLNSPDSRVVLSHLSHGPLLQEYAQGMAGIQSGDYDRFGRCFWEMPYLLPGWAFQQSTVRETADYGGREHVLLWEDGRGELAHFPGAYIRGHSAWGKAGTTVSQMRGLPVTRYTGEVWDNNTAVIIPRDPRNLPAIWAFCSSAEFAEAVRRIDKALKVTNATLAKVPIDLVRWQKEATSRYPDGLPESYSDDPTQWVFHGHPRPCASGPATEQPWPAFERLDIKRPINAKCAGWVLQIAVARLLGYRWPTELEPTMKLSGEAHAWIRQTETLSAFAADEGIVCIPPVSGEQPAADRLQRLLSHAFGAAWTPTTLSALLDSVGFSGKSLEEWLRDGFFEQHYQLFHQRPFVWHLWDRRGTDGFAVLANYHKLDRRHLERLTYTVLGDWIASQRQAAKADERGAEDRLAAAVTLQQKLAAILEGKPPYDIFVRWKPLNEQPIGWEPDLNDGVRMNIRPFVEASILRKNPRIKWNKDRGQEPESLRPREPFPWFWKNGRFTGERANDIHLTHAEKRAARQRAQAKASG